MLTVGRHKEVREKTVAPLIVLVAATLLARLVASSVRDHFGTGRASPVQRAAIGVR